MYILSFCLAFCINVKFSLEINIDFFSFKPVSDWDGILQSGDIVTISALEKRSFEL